MLFSDKFIAATKEYTDYNKHVSAPLMRRVFEFSGTTAELTVCGLGFYRLFINGKEITKGLLAPYVSAPSDVVCYDLYELTPYLEQGENVLGFMLGNGMQNGFDGSVWDFHKASWRSAPKLAFCLEIDGKKALEADENVKTHPSEYFFDGLRSGVFCDARNIVDGWCEKGFVERDWAKALSAETPKGKPRLVQAPPIRIQREVKPIRILPVKGGYIYDFGINSAGICRLTLKNATAGQEISLTHGETLLKGELFIKNILCNFLAVPPKYRHRDVYIATGKGVEVFQPHFTYHGFRYVFVEGITTEQATEELLTFLIANSDVKSLGEFNCSDEVANKLYEIAKVSDLANFYYFPTDCPQREKNGWTGDAAVSAEQMLLNFDVASSLKEWLVHIRAAQGETSGALPGIVPTGGWGFDWGNGPSWDSVLTYLPEAIYRFTGDVDVLKDNADAIYKFVKYLKGKQDRNGIINYGLGDWLQPERCANAPDSPTEVTGTIVSYSILLKAGEIFNTLGDSERCAFCQEFAAQLRGVIRSRLVDLKTCTVNGNCQTSQALGLYYGIFEPEEEQKALNKLLDIIQSYDNGHIACGMIGLRRVFRVLIKYGYADLAYDMVTRSDFPSFGYMLRMGATSLWEAFYEMEERTDGELHRKFSRDGNKPQREKDTLRKKLGRLYGRFTDFFIRTVNGNIASLNHHFLGDYCGWFISEIVGIQINPRCKDVTEVNVAPHFVTKLDFAKATREMPQGKLFVEWKRDGDKIELTIEAPNGLHGKIITPDGYRIDGDSDELRSGKYSITKRV